MSKRVDNDQLEQDMGDASSEYVSIHQDDLMNLIQRVRAGESFIAEIDTWRRRLPNI